MRLRRFLLLRTQLCEQRAWQWRLLHPSWLLHLRGLQQRRLHGAFAAPTCSGQTRQRCRQRFRPLCGRQHRQMAVPPVEAAAVSGLQSSIGLGCVVPSRPPRATGRSQTPLRNGPALPAAALPGSRAAAVTRLVAALPAVGQLAPGRRRLLCCGVQAVQRLVQPLAGAASLAFHSGLPAAHRRPEHSLPAAPTAALQLGLQALQSARGWPGHLRRWSMYDCVRACSILV